jgi:hypothetical protein
MIKDQNLIPVIYVAGAGRSGSTVIGEALGMLRGSLHLGEIRGLFDYTVDPSQLFVCSCGEPYQECAFWNPLLSELFGVDWPSTIQSFGLEGQLPSIKSLFWRQIIPSIHVPGSDRVEKIIPVLELALAKSHTRIIIDSSKSASFAWMLTRTGKAKILLIHVIRDPHGVLFSWMRHPIPVPDKSIGITSSRTLTFYEAFIDWIKSNGGIHLLKMMGFPYMQIKYEDFVANPEKVMRSIIQEAQKNNIDLQESKSAMELLAKQQVSLDGHLVGGNTRLKSKKGIVTLKLDNPWREQQLTGWEKLMLNIAVGPWVIFYGYLGRK